MVRRKKKTLLEQSQVQEEEMLLCKASDLRSLLKDKVTILADLNVTQLSNPQKYTFDFSRGMMKGVERIWVNSIHLGGWL